jgi:hypothetical protein
MKRGVYRCPETPSRTFERADGGTLFLDELATAPMLVQEKLLRVIEYGELERVGGSQPLQVNVRLVCATNANLPEMVAEEKFRADLLDRLAFDVVQLPAARAKSDIMLLADQFAIQMCRELGLPLFPGFSDYAGDAAGLPLAGKYSRTEKRRGALRLSPRQQRDGAGQHHYRSFQRSAPPLRTSVFRRRPYSP